MSKNRTDLLENDALPQDFFDSIQEWLGTYVSPNFQVVLVNPTTLRVPAGPDNAQVGIAINGKWRYNSANADVAAPGGLTIGDNPLFVTSSANQFGPNGAPPPTELDSTNYTFRLTVKPSGGTPSGTGVEAQYRQIGTVAWDGAQFTAVKLTIGIATTPTYTPDVVARSALAQQVLIGSVGGAAGVALGSTGDATLVRDTTGGTKVTVNVPVNATAYQVGGVALAASNLSNGVTGSGAVVLAVSPALTGTPTVPTAPADTSTGQAASTAFVLGQVATATPTMDGAAAVGTSTRFARGDHVHPTDTSRAPLAGPTFSGVASAATPGVDTNTTQLATTQFVLGQAAAAAPIMDGVAAAGASTRYARADHVHPIDTSRAPLVSPVFTGAPAAPTPAVGDNSTLLATTQFVKAQGYSVDTTVVHLASAETLTGVKTFSLGPRYSTQSVAAVATLVDGSAGVVLTDTTAGAFTLTLPAAPTAGSWFTFIDSTGQWGTNALTIGRNAKNIDGAAANLTLAQANGSIRLYYDGTGWRTVALGLVGFLGGAPVSPTPLTADNSTRIATTAWVRAQNYVTGATSPVVTIFGRGGTVVAQAGDYNASQVTSAADKSAAAAQVFTGNVQAPNLLAVGAGTAAAPSISFTTDTASGMFSGGAGLIRLAAGGQQRVDLSTAVATGYVSSLASSVAASSGTHIRLGDTAWSSVNTGTLRGIHFPTTITPPGGWALAGSVIGVDYAPALNDTGLAGAMTGTFHGVLVEPDLNNATQVLSNFVGLNVTPAFGTAALTNFKGIQLGAPSVTQAVTDYRGLAVLSPGIGAGGSISTLYGIKVEVQTAGGTNWGIHVGGVNNAFAGNSRFGGTNVPSYPVDVTGDANVSGLYRINGVALGAANLSNGVTGSGAVVLAASPALTTPSLSSPTMTGTPTAPTPATSDSSTLVATTAFVRAVLPAGVIVPYVAAAAPSGWLLCDGSAQSRATYAALFAVIGTVYGAGDGSTTFNLPDMRGRTPVGKNTATFATLGATGGAETHVLTSAEMPSHQHTGSTGSENNTHSHSGTTGGRSAGHTHVSFNSAPVMTWAANFARTGTGKGVSDINGITGSSDPNVGTPQTQGESNDHTHAFGTSTQSANHQHSFTTDPTGGGAAHSILSPYQVVNYIVKT